MNIAVIPARGGSKRIARKNVKEFSGRPMISYAISAAQQSGLFEHVIVSTDDTEIIHISHAWQAEIPFIRPTDLADDHTGTVPVIAHAIEACLQLGWSFDFVCCIYPCVPFIQKDDLLDSLRLIQAQQVDYVFPVAEFPHPIQRALRRDERGRTAPFFSDYERSRTQDLETAYHDAGQFYWGRKEAWLSNQQIHSSGIGMVIPHWRVIDIDTPDDWQRAELLYRALQT